MDNAPRAFLVAGYLITLRLSRHRSPSVVLISVNKLLALSNSAYNPNGIFAKHSNFIICILERRCLAKWPCIRNAILQSEHLKGLGSDEDNAGDVESWKLNKYNTIREHYFPAVFIFNINFPKIKLQKVLCDNTNFKM